jgi:hypothetical protein
VRGHRRLCCQHTQDPPELRSAAATLAALHRKAELDAERARLVERLVGLDCDPPTSEVAVGGDLPRRSEASLRAEAQRLRFGLLFHPTPPAWWAQRLEMIHEVLNNAR